MTEKKGSPEKLAFYRWARVENQACTRKIFESDPLLLRHVVLENETVAELLEGRRVEFLD
jgi:hypothetical protein